MRLWALAALALLLAASCIALWTKLRWRVARLYDIEELGYPETGAIVIWDHWVNGFNSAPPFKDLPFTPTLSCEPLVSELLWRYDWLVTPLSPFSGKNGCGKMEPMPWAEITFKGDPRTVWAAPMAIDRLMDLAEQHCDPSHNDRLVHFAGTEDPLSHAFGETWSKRNATVKRLQKYFKRIVYQTMDIVLEGVQLAPMGLSWGYLDTLLFALAHIHQSPAWHGRQFVGLVENASRVNLSFKTKGILATKSKVAAWLDTNHTIQSALRIRRDDPLNMLFPTKTNSSLRSVIDAWESRARMRWFVQTPMAARAGVDWRSLPVPDWWTEMPKYKFLLNPIGSAIMTSKTFEALLALTVPIIVHKGYNAVFELRKLGFPLVIIDAWIQVTPENTEVWWSQLSPRLEGFRKNCLTVDGYWKMITGQVKVCQ